MKKILVIVKKDGKDALKIGRDIIKYLESKGIETVCDLVTARDMKIDGVDPAEVDADLVLVLGGDGTLLWAEAQISGRGIPLLGINFGTMGFLTEVSPDKWQEALDRVLKGRYRIEKRSKINVSINGEQVGRALNEVVVKTAVPVEMLSLDIKVDDQDVETVMADGIIVATPTGSTAYSMSVGGPILDHRVPAFIITAISPFKLGSRPIIVPETSRIKVKITSNKSGVVVIDGEFRNAVSNSDVIEYTISSAQAHILKLEKDFYDKIQRRLRK